MKLADAELVAETGDRSAVAVVLDDPKWRPVDGLLRAVVVHIEPECAAPAAALRELADQLDEKETTGG
jgi:hypothetical protein